MLIQELHLTNLLSFGPDSQPIDLRSLNVLIGPNGSGKSNLIEALALLRSAPRDLPRTIRDGGGVRDWVWQGNPEAICKLQIIGGKTEDNPGLRYCFAFAASDQRFELVDERLEETEARPGHAKPYFYFGYENGRPMLNVAGEQRNLRPESIDPSQSILAQRRDPDQYPELTRLAEILTEIRIYREWSFGRYTKPRLPQKADLPNDRLEEDASNLGLVLNRLRSQPQIKKRILEELGELYSGVEDFDVRIEGGTVQVFFQERGSSNSSFIVPATRLSDGTLRYLCLLAILLDPTPPPLICLEEPELGLHPDVIPALARLLVEASERTQLLVTTHSDILIDALGTHPEHVVICEKHEGQTRLQRLDGEALRSWLEEYSLGRLWLQGELGGTRW